MDYNSDKQAFYHELLPLDHDCAHSKQIISYSIFYVTRSKMAACVRRSLLKGVNFSRLLCLQRADVAKSNIGLFASQRRYASNVNQGMKLLQLP